MDKRICEWAEGQFDQYIKYHDEEWGVSVHEDQKHFEFLILESAQAGLSWATILKKREGYREAFANFDVRKVAKFSDEKIEEMLQNPAIIRNRAKVLAAVNNAQRFIEIQKEFGTFDAYIWKFVGGKPIVNKWQEMSQVPVTTPESDALSKDLKKRGFKFVGSTTIYAHMQAIGLVNDHTMDCFRHSQCQ